MYTVVDNPYIHLSSYPERFLNGLSKDIDIIAGKV